MNRAPSRLSDIVGDYSTEGSDSVPTYTENDDEGLATLVSSLQEMADVQLPLTHLVPWSQWPRGDDGLVAFDAWSTQHRIVDSFFSAVRKKNTEVVTLFVRDGLVSPDVTSASGETPLLAAVDAGNGTMVCTLGNLGADVNAYGRSRFGAGGTVDGVERTPLQLAAAQGRLALVRLLVETYGADDGLVAPDGQLALRLAADGGHREVVKFLPARRGGEWRRWKKHHDVAVRRIKRAVKRIGVFFHILVWDLPRFLVWSCPKHLVVLPIMEGSKWAWKNRGRFGGWCKRQVLETPKRLKRAVDGVWRGIKGIPKAVKSVVLWLWRAVRAIPTAVKIASLWLWESAKKIGGAAVSVVAHIVSFLHTVVMAVVGFFRRITFKDILNAMGNILAAIFIDLPKAVWSGLRAAVDASYKMVKALFGAVGEAVWWTVRGLIYVVQYVPEQLWNIVKGMGSSMAKGCHEVLVWFDPKR